MLPEKAELARLLRTVRHLHPMQIVHRLRLRALRRWHVHPLYLAVLRRHVSRGVLRVPADPWPGDATRGRLIGDGTIRLLHLDAAIAPVMNWAPADKSDLWRFTLHYFEWLGDLKAAGDAVTARRLLRDWLNRYGSTPDPALAWHPYPLSLRLFSWLRYANFVLEGADDLLITDFWDSVERQARHLPRVLEKDVGGNHLIKNLKSLIAVGLCLRGHERRVGPALDALVRQIKKQILPDGLHAERSPSYHAQVLADLIDIEALLTQADRPPPFILVRAIAAMREALAFLRHPDGGLALFNDGSVGDPAWLDHLIGRAGPTPVLDHAGYYRLTGGTTVVLADVGKIGPDNLPAHAHADTLSFEMSSGAHRLIVNGGTYAYQDPVWRAYFRATKAHSTVEVDRHDSAEIYGVFRVGRRPGRVVAAYHAQDGELIGDHDGYGYLGLAHERRWRLSADGQRLTGRDVIEKTDGDAFPHAVIARFHLHPAVRAQALDDGAARLTLPDGAVWLFKAAGGAVDLRDSVYAPDFHILYDTTQIAVTARLAALRLVLDWSLTRVE